MTDTVKKLIDRVTSGKGTLRIPVWWMRNVLHKTVEAIDRTRASVAKVQNNVDKVQNNVDKVQKNLEATAAEGIGMVSEVQGNIDKVQADVDAMEVKWPWIRCDRDSGKLVISDGENSAIIEGLSMRTDTVVECTASDGVSALTVNGKVYGVDNGKIHIRVPVYLTDYTGLFKTTGSGTISDIDLSGLDTSLATDMSEMFCGFKGKSLDVSGFDTSKVTSMNKMFAVCPTLASLDLSNFDLTSVTDMGIMFVMCAGLKTVKIDGIGKNAGMKNFTTVATGILKESILYILRDHSFDRAAAGYAPCVVTVPRTSLPELTSEEKAAITAKGFTLTSN